MARPRTKQPKTIDSLSDVRPQRRNANRGTPRGRGMLEHSVRGVGWIGAITVAADGETFAGSKRLEVAADVLDGLPIVVHTDGSRPVIVVRDDIPSADDPRAVEAGLADNRVAAVSLEWDPAVLAGIKDDGEVDLLGLWTPAELQAALVDLGAGAGDALSTAGRDDNPAGADESDGDGDDGGEDDLDWALGRPGDHECPACGHRWRED